MAKKKVADLEAELGGLRQQLQQRERDAAQQEQLLEGERQRLQEAERLHRELEAQQSELQAQKEERSEAQAQLGDRLQHAESRLESGQRALLEAGAANAALERRLAEAQQEAVEAKRRMVEKESMISKQEGVIEQQIHEQGFAKRFLDIVVGDCEFASPFAYFLTMKLASQGDGQSRSTSVSQPSQRPVFDSSSVLLSLGAALPETEVLEVSSYVSIADPAAVGMSPMARLLGKASIPLTGLQLPEPQANSSRRLTRRVDLLRAVGVESNAGRAAPGGAQEEQKLVVGRVTMTMQVKVLTPKDLAARADGDAADVAAAASAPLPLASPTLDKSLWIARPFQPCLRALLHRVGSLPLVPAGRHATVRVAMRLLHTSGKLLQESVSSDVAMKQSGMQAEGLEAIFGQEVLLPLPLSPGELKGTTVQLSLDLLSSAGAAVAAGASVDVDVLLDLRFSTEALPAFMPVHLQARASRPAPQPRPSLLLSLTREPSEEALPTLGDGSLHGSEIRVFGIPVGRPLLEPVDGAIVAVFPEPSSHRATASGGEVHLPVTTYFYDQPLDLEAFLRSHFFAGGAAKNPQVCFLTPAVLGPSRSPQWGEFTLRLAASAGALARLEFYVFRLDDGLREPAEPFGARLLGLACLDASGLVAAATVPAGQGEETAKKASPTPPQRSYLLDLRLMEAPGAPSSLEVECRVWPRVRQVVAHAATAMGEAIPAAAAVPPLALPQALGSAAKPAAVRPAAPAQVASNAVPVAGLATVMSPSSVTAGLKQGQHEFRLNHELSVQLAKEFNLRADALKRAGEEIIALRRQVQLLRNENAQLRKQLQEEETFTEEAKGKPIPEGLENISSDELASKLRQAVERYREEKRKGRELAKRLEQVLKEVGKGRSLERTLEELEGAHCEQNRELQRLQEESKKVESYRQTMKSQEKVIAKLEKILEGSLQEVQKAQQVQADVERLKTENIRLRDKCANLAAKRKSVAKTANDEEDLRRRIAEKDAEVAQLEAQLREMQERSTAPLGAGAQAEEVMREQARLRELEDSRAEWEQRCAAAEQRLQMLKQQVADSSRRYGSEISALKVDIAKKDAKVLELEYLLRAAGGGVGAGSRP